ncbi:hypothetical protein CIK77_03170 [Microbacterium sp. JB110]|nr:hypothetical protein CIK77_03170 [Microbacterium sp. JB110]
MVAVGIVSVIPVSLLVHRRSGGCGVVGIKVVTDTALPLIDFLSVELICDVQNQRDQSGSVRRRAQPWFGRDSPACARRSIVPHAR